VTDEPVVRVLGPRGHARASRIRAGFPSAGRPDVVHVFAPSDARWSLLPGVTFAGLVLSPLGPATPFGWWHRPYLRLLVETQGQATEFVRAGWPLGRVAVVPAGPFERESLLTLYREVASMARWRGRR
jgi:hypothetical protein